MKKIIVLTCCALVCSLSYADVLDSLRVVLKYEQDEVSRIEILEQVARLTVTTNKEEAQSAILEGIALAEQNDWEEKVGLFHFLWGFKENHSKNFGEAFKQFSIALPSFSTQESSLFKATTLEYLG
ncbi:MAG: hypothetical protein AAFQ98_20395, partial [Bacteroidota bacterium]